MTCSIAGCDRKAKARGWCGTHYQRFRVHGDPNVRQNKARPRSCIVEDCTSPVLARQMCSSHYTSWRAGTGTGTAVCVIDDCGRPSITRGWCSRHYQRFLRWGDPLTTAFNKDRADNGDGCLMANGYRLLYRPEHPSSNAKGYIPEHRLVMAQVLGRPLLNGENVHHVNGVRDDNRPANLELWVSSQPSGQRVQDLLAWAREIERRYGNLPDALT